MIRVPDNDGMLASRLFWKLLLACAGLNLVAAVAFGFILSTRLQGQIVEQVDLRLKNAAHLVRGEMAEEMQGGRSEALQQRVRDLGQETGTRFTLVSMDGTVLADSDHESPAEVAAMENHRDRPEIALARALGEGTSVRTSSTLEAPYRYFALRADRGGEPIGIIRAALPLDSIESQTDAARRLIWGLVAAVCLCVAGLAYWIVGHIIRPVTALTDAAEAIASGDYEHRVYVDNRDELGRLADTFNRMCQELDGRMRQLSQTSDRQATVLGGMIEGVIAVDSRQRVVLANYAAGRLFGFGAAAADGRPLLEVVRNHSVHEAVTRALGNRHPQRLEIKREGTDKLYLNVHVQPMPGEPCPGVVLVMHDTTELRRLESLRREFLANVSHELKTPLSSIKAYAETLRNGAISDAEASQRFLARIEEQTDRLHHLIMDMLMLARIESDQQVFEIDAIDVAATVGACLEHFRTVADAKRIHLYAATGQPSCRVRADREGLRDILENLVDNAIKYTPEGGEVSVAWQQNGSMAQISVRDTGIGIKPDDQRRVFERFYRVDKARSRELGGTGLGLAIVKHLAQSFGGRAGVRSEPGKGSTFTVELPLF